MMDRWCFKQCPRCGGDIHLHEWRGIECVQCSLVLSKRQDGWISPMLAKLHEEVFDSEEHLFEPKYDGIRCLAYINNGEYVLINRSLNVVTDKFPDIVPSSNAKSCILDGELVCLDTNGRPDFQLMQTRMNRQHDIDYYAQATPATFMVFDIMAVNGWDISELELLKRKTILSQVVKIASNVQLSPFVVKNGIDMYAKYASLGWEGIMAKQCRSKYLPGRRTRSWLKLKTTQTAVVSIGGCSYGFGKRSGTFGAILAGVPYEDKLLFCGEIGTGFDDAELEDLVELMGTVKTSKSPFISTPNNIPVKMWCKPVLNIRVSYLEISDAGMLRHPSYETLV
jgi:bifunctional non-homologous end joining protein LigD